MWGVEMLRIPHPQYFLKRYVMEIKKNNLLSLTTVDSSLNRLPKIHLKTESSKQANIYSIISEDIQDHINTVRLLTLKNNRQLIPTISTLICDPDMINSDLLKSVINYCNDASYSLEERNKLKIFLSTEIDICTNIYKQYIKSNNAIDKQILIEFRACIFENSNIISKKSMLYNHAEYQSNMNDVFAMKFVDREALQLKGCTAFEGIEGAEFGVAATNLYPASERYIDGVTAGYNFLKKQMLGTETITFEVIEELALIIHRYTYPNSMLPNSSLLFNCHSKYSTTNPYSFLEKVYLPSVPYSIKPLNLYKLYSTLKYYSVPVFDNNAVSKIEISSLSTKFENIQSISEIYTQIWTELQEQIEVATSDQAKILAIIMFGAKFEIFHLFQNHNNRMMAIMINLLLEKYCKVSANFYHVNGLSHITMLTILENLEKDRLQNSTIGRYNYQHFLQEITDGIYWFLINVEMQQ